MSDYSFFEQYCFEDQPQIQFLESSSDYQVKKPDEMINDFIDFIRAKEKINIVRWDPPRIEYPPYMFLGGDRGILAYIVFSYIRSDTAFAEKMLSTDSAKVLGILQKADSHLDRPIFFIDIIDCLDVKGVFFETNEQIKDRWLQTSFASKTYTPVFDEMGDYHGSTGLLVRMLDLQ